MSWEAIHDAANDCDVEALRRELERGVDPNLAWNHGNGRRRSRRRLSPLRRLPPEVLRRIVAYAFHAGYY